MSDFHYQGEEVDVTFHARDQDPDDRFAKTRQGAILFCRRAAWDVLPDDRARWRACIAEHVNNNVYRCDPVHKISDPLSAAQLAGTYPVLFEAGQGDAKTKLFDRFAFPAKEWLEGDEPNPEVNEWWEVSIARANYDETTLFLLPVRKLEGPPEGHQEPAAQERSERSGERRSAQSLSDGDDPIPDDAFATPARQVPGRRRVPLMVRGSAPRSPVQQERRQPGPARVQRESARPAPARLERSRPLPLRGGSRRPRFEQVRFEARGAYPVVGKLDGKDVFFDRDRSAPHEAFPGEVWDVRTLQEYDCAFMVVLTRKIS